MAKLLGGTTIYGTGTVLSTLYVGGLSNTSTAVSTSTLTGALTVTGGVGIGGNLNVGGNVVVSGVTTFNSPVTFNGTSTYLLSTNTFYTDNIIEVHVPTTGIGTQWTVDDGRDIGLRFHYFNRTLGTDSNAALVLADDSQNLEWYITGSENSSGVFTGSAVYGTFKTGSILLANTTTALTTQSGALQVSGGVGIGGSLYVGGPSTFTNTLTIGGGIASGLVVGGAVTATNYYTSNGYQVVSGNTFTYLTVTGTNISASTTTGALFVAGGIGVGGGIYAGGTVTATNYYTSNGYQVVSGNTFTYLTVTGTNISASTTTGALFVAGGIGVGGGIYAGGTVTATTIVTTGVNGSISGVNTLSSVNVFVTGVSNATSTITGALQVVGGVGIGGNLYVGGSLNVQSTLTFVSTSSLVSPKLQAYQETITQLGTVTSATNINCQLSNIFDVTLGTGTVVFSFINPPSTGTAQPVTILLRQDSVGNRAATFTNAKYSDGLLPVLSTGSNQVDVLTFFTVNGGSFWFGTFAMANVS